ncbi:MAG TPA: trypsin-like peptidase domain-containing protein [Pseudonocardiaceae bacterium]|jgi:putative serine protease PepD|nr:trypsin-like peptidase domain-containing protein [Pseudonocardiaceae bacterium]
MTENTPGAAGNVPEHLQQSQEGAALSGPESAATPEPEQPRAESPASATEEQDLWSAAGYQTYRPTEQTGYPSIPAAQLPGAEAPTSYASSSGYPSLGTSSDSSASYQANPNAGVNFGSYPPLSNQQTVSMPVPAPPKRGRGPLIAGVIAVAVVVGGLAGSLGGYLVGSNNSGAPVQNALSAPVPTATQAAAPAGSVQSVANKVLPTVVEISVQIQSAQGVTGDTGSGIIISSDGQILTNNHVIAAAATAGAGQSQLQVIFSNGHTVNATILGRDPTSDIAVIKAQSVSGLPVATLGTASSLQVGQSVVAIGAPYGLSGTVTSGIVSSLHRPTVASDGGQNSQTTVMDAIQTDAPINPGNSGGALVNTDGQVIGINSAIYSSSSSSGQGGNVGIGFAIPIDQARRLATDIVSTGHSTQTVLGVTVTDNVEGIPAAQQGQLDPQQQAQEEEAGLTNGAYIASVTSGGPADKGGLKQGAVVVKANGRLITSANGLIAAVHAAAPNDQMTLTLSDGSTVQVVLSGETVQTN